MQYYKIKLNLVQKRAPKHNILTLRFEDLLLVVRNLYFLKLVNSEYPMSLPFLFS